MSVRRVSVTLGPAPERITEFVLGSPHREAFGTRRGFLRVDPGPWLIIARMDGTDGTQGRRIEARRRAKAAGGQASGLPETGPHATGQHATGPHETVVRVRYGEVDRMGVVYHAHYIVYFELGRTEFLRSLGETYRRVEDEGTLLVVVETGVRHHRPAQYDDLLTIRTRLVELGGVRLRFEYEVVRDGRILATGFTVLASTTRAGRPCRMPAAFRERIARVAAGGKTQPEDTVQGASRGGP